MIDANQLRKKTIFTMDGELYKVLDFSHNKTARGGATIRTKIINLRSGAITESTFNSGNKVEDVSLDYEDAEYLYNDGTLYYFMNTDTYEQTPISADTLGHLIYYLADNLAVKLSSYQGEPIDIELPATVELEVVEAEPSVAGNTATDVTKDVIVSTGLRVKTPDFVNEGDKIKINTESGEYITRVKD